MFQHLDCRAALAMTGMAMKQPAVYIMDSKKNGTLYTGATSNLAQRVCQHKDGIVPGFTVRYACKLLVYFEVFDTMDYAIMREKQIKAGSRKLN